MSAIFQTVQALHERVSRSAFRTPMLWGMLLVVFLLIYMPMLVRGGYHWDETLDFAGQGMETYVANGRWGLVLWRWVFGLGCAVWLNGLLAGGLLVAAMVVQLRVLRVEHTGAQLLYGLLYLVLVQFAYQMDYFYQCDATAAGVLCVSLAVLCLQRGGRGALLGATLAVLFAVAVYQCLVLNFAVLLGLVVVQRMLSGERAELWRTLGRGAAVCVLAVLGWWGIKALVLQLVPVSDNVLVYCAEYAERINYREQLFSSEWYVYLWRMFSTMVRDALIPLTYDGELFYAAAALAGMVLAVALCRRSAGVGAAVGRVLLLFALWVAPFSMYMVVGETWPCYPHTKMAQPLVLAAFWVLVVQYVPWRPLWRGVGVCALLVCTVQAATLVARHAAHMQARFEERLMRLHHAETEGVRVAVQHGITPSKGCILYYTSTHDWSRGGFVDFCGDYPALLYMRGATDAELYRLHRATLREMPEWPAAGSVRVVGDKVIIKGSEI